MEGSRWEKLVLAQWEFSLPRRDQWIREDWLWEEKRNAIFRSMGPVHPTQHHTSEDYSLKQHCCQNSNLIFDSTNKEIDQVNLPYGMSSCMWKCIYTFLQKIQFCSPYDICKIGCVIKILQSIQLEMLAITRRHLCPQPQTFIVCKNPWVCSEVGQCHIC